MRKNKAINRMPQQRAAIIHPGSFKKRFSHKSPYNPIPIRKAVA
jgi:hypothetical protein